jgi:hypothetical protein
MSSKLKPFLWSNVARALRTYEGRCCRPHLFRRRETLSFTVDVGGGAQTQRPGDLSELS